MMSDNIKYTAMAKTCTSKGGCCTKTGKTPKKK